ncbi:MAG: FAD-dependent oxidoreductase [Anaerolineae bacterium]|nr:FAD-dependent oxidoreductase [Anaerolineae bacterium]NUQ02883.1 FAD-dependent oxidoreductase [Anaerolineae bacterium]
MNRLMLEFADYTQGEETMYDVIVIGAGAVGSATAYAAARSGARVLLLEQFEIDHGRGSSHGASRILRHAYDHPVYVAMARDSFLAWADLESESGELGHLQNEYGHILYGLPSVDGSGSKVGVHGGKPIDPQSPDRLPDPEVIAAMTRFSERVFPTASQHKPSRVCLYTNTPDEYFMIDLYPEHRHVVIASCCSGHGIKFSSVLGQTIAHLALTGEPLRDLSLFTLARFSAEAE